MTEPSDSPSSVHLALTQFGGVRGFVISLVPAVVLAVTVPLLGIKIATLVAAITLAIIFVERLLRRKNFNSVLLGMLNLAIGIVLALGSGQDRNFFLPGILVNLVFLLLFVSLYATPYNPIRFLSEQAAALDMLRNLSKPTSEQYRKVSRVWIAMFATRVGVMLPMWIANQVSALAAARVVLGAPLFVAVLWLSWQTLGSTPNADGGRDRRDR